MAYRLANREKQIPNGFKWVQPETGWQPPKYASFRVLVNALIAHRKQNPHLIAQKNWAVAYDAVAEEVDAFNATNCARHGWMDYIIDGLRAAPPPKPQALLQQEKSAIVAAAGKARKIWGGIRTLNDWIDSGSPAVPQELAESRAATCAACPKNGKGDLTSWFTKPASEVIAKQIAKLRAMKLATKSDADVQVCEVCLCPLKLKVHTPIIYIKEHLSAEVLSELRQVPGCWLPQEIK